MPSVAHANTHVWDRLREAAHSLQCQSKLEKESERRKESGAVSIQGPRVYRAGYCNFKCFSWHMLLAASPGVDLMLSALPTNLQASLHVLSRPI